MPAQSDLSAISDLLACPSCRGELRVAAGRLTCVVCSRQYPIIDGIPLLIPQGPEPGPTS